MRPRKEKADSNELNETAARLESAGAKIKQPDIDSVIRHLVEAATEVGKAWSGSWFGYHSRVYYNHLQPPPPGAHFSQEWGLMYDEFLPATKGDWVEYDFDDVRDAIFNRAGNPKLEPAGKLADETRGIVEESREKIISILTTLLKKYPDDPYLIKQKKEAEDFKTLYSSHFVKTFLPSGQLMSRDEKAYSQGIQTPPHFSVLADLRALTHPFDASEKLAKVAKRTVSHLDRSKPMGKPKSTERGGAGDEQFNLLLFWAKEQSEAVALALHEWLPRVVPGIKPWMSTEDIAKGPWTPWHYGEAK